MATDKRRFLSLLPAINQTETLKKYFGSTVDVLFQPGKAESLSGYIGLKPSYYDAAKDFYIPEPNPVRAAHQLEPAMISRDTSGSINQLFFLDDLVNYLRSSNAVVTDQNRLFADEFYSWAPPVDLDKLTNPHQYYWFGDNPELLPFLTLTADFGHAKGDGTTSRFALPPAKPGLDASHESPVVYVNRVPVDFERDGDDVLLVNTPENGAPIIVYRYGDLTQVLDGLVSFDPTPFSTSGVTALTSGMRVVLQDGLARYWGYDRLPFENPKASATHATDTPWDRETDAREFWIEGVGSSIQCVPVNRDPDFPTATPVYVTIDRRSKDWNVWSRNNYWVHRDAFSWAGVTFPDRKAVRPIIEFIANVELYDYGTNRLADITGTLTGDPSFCPVVFDRPDGSPVSDWDILAYDMQPLESSGLSQIALADINGKEVGTVYVDGGRKLRPGDRILVLQNDNPDLQGRILTARQVPGRSVHSTVNSDWDTLGDDTDGWDTVLNNADPYDTMVLAIEVSAPPQTGDITRIRTRGYVPFDLVITGFDTEPWDASRLPLEYWFNGIAWVEAQQRQPDDSDPRFELYTGNHTRHERIAGSTFAGNRLFGFAAGTGIINDSYLQRSVSYDASGHLLYEYDLATRHTVIGSDVIGGYQYFRVYGETDTYLNGWMPTGAYSAQSLTNGVYSTPLNLSANADNEEVGLVSRSQWFEHVTTAIESQTGFSGSPYARSNWRDTLRDLSKGRSILESRSPLLKSMLLASDARFDYFDAVRYADREYTRFRAKFAQNILEVQRTGQATASDAPDIWVLAVLRNLMVAKTVEFPFSLSLMAGGQFFIPPTAAFLGLLAAVEPGIETDDTYATPVQMLRGHDGSRTPLFGDVRDDILLALEQRIYASIQAKFKTERPLGFDLWDFLSGRDRPTGDGTSAINAIGNNACALSLPTTTGIDASQNDASPTITPQSLRYSRDEVIQLYTPMFMRWVQRNRLDFLDNDAYDIANPFTWNYRGLLDRDGNAMPGNWRAIYRWYFDTDRPHLAPWEMLGFPSKPSWFDAEYGAAPYTRGNLKLWTDLRDGRVARGQRQGIDARFARPDLLAVLPVDDDGNLLDPLAAGIMPVAPTEPQGMRPWAIGDQGPVENLWMNSTSYRFDMAQVACLMRPAQWVEMGWDTLNTDRVNGQWLNTLNGDRPRSMGLLIHGELLTDGSRILRYGLQQWISDLMVSRAQDPSILGDAVRGIECRLSHRMAGFTRSDSLRVFADNFGILPSEDVEIIYHESAPIREVSYSGVIVEWTGEGWRVVGYDAYKQSFCIMPGDTAGPKTTIKLGNNPIIYEWRANVYYPVNRLVEYQGSVYRCIQAHTSAQKFEAEFWQADPQHRPYPQATVCDLGTGEVTSVPYGTVFTTYQEIASFLRDYARWLEACGFVFDTPDPVTDEIQDWLMAIKQFLMWGQMQWQPGNFIALSPAASSLKFITQHGMVYNVEQDTNGIYSLLDRTGHPLSRRDTFVSRLDEETKIVATTNNLFAARLSVGEIEHVLVFSNRTIFNDIVYEPLYNLRQSRLRLIGERAQDWAGRRDAPGYVIQDNNLLPSFEKASDDIRHMFDIEHADAASLRDKARHLVGYQDRPYLDNLMMSETQQFEFYQGMIQTKGASAAFDKLARSHFIDQTAELQFLEEWALRTSLFGAVTKSALVSFNLTRSDIRSDPQFIRFDSKVANDGVVHLSANDARWVERPSTLDIFTYRNDPADEFTSYRGFDEWPLDLRAWDIRPVAGGPEVRVRRNFLPTAGYVRRDEVDYSARDMGLLQRLYTNVMNAGKTFQVQTRIWVYDRGDGSFDVLECFNLDTPDTLISRIDTYFEDPTIQTGTRIVFNAPHGLINKDIGLRLLIVGETATHPDLQGVQVLSEIENDHSIFIEYTATQGFDYTLNQPDSIPLVYILRPMRFTDIPSAQAFFLRFYPPDYQTVYVDDAGNGSWAAYTFDGVTQKWVVSRQQPRKLDSERIAQTSVYDRITKMDDTSLSPEPTLFDRFTVIDPVAGLIPGVAEKELSYKLETDPAIYYEGSGRRWGVNEVGRLWWDLSTVRFLETELDILGSGDVARVQSEIQYRVKNWGQLAPGTSVDIYEWTGSYVHPIDYPGLVYGGTTPPYAESTEFDPQTGRIQTIYFFWVRSPTTVPVGATWRSLSAAAVASLISSPASNNLPWIAPILPNGLLVGGIQDYLTEQTSVLQIKLTKDDYEGNVHTEWQLVRKNDGITQPPDMHWRALRNSLVGFDDLVRAVPDPNLPVQMQTGLSFVPRKSLFAEGRQGMLDARRSFVSAVNAILAQTDVLYQNAQAMTLLTQSSSPFKQLVWRQQPGEEGVIPPPFNTWDFAVDGIEERDALLETYPFLIKRGFVPWDMVRYDELGFDLDFNHTALNGGSPRVLVKNLESDHPSWSVWEIDPTSVVGAPPDEILKLSKNYDVSYPTRAEMVADGQNGFIAVGTRILVQADEFAEGFWTVWAYRPGDPNAEVNGFVFLNAQLYRTSDFWQPVDWYAPGYTPATPPVIQYANLAARTRYEMPAPQNPLVKVADDGTGNWIWTAWDGMTWNVVARQNGTLALTSDFYDPSRVVYGVFDLFLRSVPVRDGSWEIQALFDILRSGILTSGQSNELFFSMLHFIHAQQDVVDWAFKTSFLSVVGFNEKLGQSPIQNLDNTDNLLAYIDEVKPYRVKTRDYSRMLSPSLDQASVRATDFDKPLYYDERYGAYRRLDMSFETDLATLGTEPWKEWLDNYLKTSTDPASSNYNPVRRMNLTLKFDRIDPGATPLEVGAGWDYLGFDLFQFDEIWEQMGTGGSALNRMLDYYQPTLGMREKSAETLLGTGFKGIEIEGGDLYVPTDSLLSDWDIRPYDMLPHGGLLPVGRDSDIDVEPQGEEIDLNPDNVEPVYGLKDPYQGEGHPQELVPSTASDMIGMTVTSDWTVGAPNQFTAYINTAQTRRASVVLSFEHIPGSAEMVMVYRDGVRAIEGTDYSIDHFARKVTVTLGTPRAKLVQVHVFTSSGLTKFGDQRFFIGDGITTTFAMSQPALGNVEVLVNGVLQDPATISVDGSNVALTEAPGLNAEIMISVRHKASDWDVAEYETTGLNTGWSDIDTATRLKREVFTYNDAQTWSLDEVIQAGSVSPGWFCPYFNG